MVDLSLKSYRTPTASSRSTVTKGGPWTTSGSPSASTKCASPGPPPPPPPMGISLMRYGHHMAIMTVMPTLGISHPGHLLDSHHGREPALRPSSLLRRVVEPGLHTRVQGLGRGWGGGSAAARLSGQATRGVSRRLRDARGCPAAGRRFRGHFTCTQGGYLGDAQDAGDDPRKHLPSEGQEAVSRRLAGLALLRGPGVHLSLLTGLAGLAPSSNYAAAGQGPGP